MDQILKTIYSSFANSVGIAESTLAAEDPSLADLVARSPNLHNSVDLMEAFARAASMVKRDHGLRIRLPAYPMDTALSRVFAAFAAEVARQSATQTSDPTAMEANDGSRDQ